MDDTRAHECLSGVQALIDEWGALYDRRWGRDDGYERDELDPQLKDGIDKVRARTKLAHDVIAAMGEGELAARVVEHEEGQFGGHPFTRARIAIVEAVAILSQREELAEIVGPVGPQLSASSFHPVIWGAAAALWDDGHYRSAVQTAASALEALLQTVAGPGLGGQDLGKLFALEPPTAACPRLRIRGVDPNSPTWTSAHTGAGSAVRAAFMAVRNLVSHPGWPEPAPSEALEMIAVLSFVAHLADRCDTETAP